MQTVKILPRVMIWLGFAFCIGSVISTTVFYVTIYIRGTRGDPAFWVGNIVFGIVGIITMLLGEYIKGYKERLAQRERRDVERYEEKLTQQTKQD